MTEFKVTPVRGISPIIIDYNNYKITIMMLDGVTVKFFMHRNDRWYKVKETKRDYFQIDECIAWAKSRIDEDNGWFELQRFIKSKEK